MGKVATYPLPPRGSPPLRSGGQNQKWPTGGQLGYITLAAWGVPTASERGAESEVAAVRNGKSYFSGAMQQMLHHPCILGDIPNDALLQFCTTIATSTSTRLQNTCQCLQLMNLRSTILCLRSCTCTLLLVFHTHSGYLCSVHQMTKDNCTISTICSRNGPLGVVVSELVWVCFFEFNKDRICTVRSDCKLTILAGGGSATFLNPCGVVFDGDSNITVTDTCKHRIRKITPDGTVTTVAGKAHVVSLTVRGLVHNSIILKAKKRTKTHEPTLCTDRTPNENYRRCLQLLFPQTQTAVTSLPKYSPQSTTYVFLYGLWSACLSFGLTVKSGQVLLWCDHHCKRKVVLAPTLFLQHMRGRSEDDTQDHNHSSGQEDTQHHNRRSP